MSVTATSLACFYNSDNSPLFDVHWQRVNGILCTRKGRAKLRVMTLAGDDYILTFSARETLERARADINSSRMRRCDFLIFILLLAMIMCSSEKAWKELVPISIPFGRLRRDFFVYNILVNCFILTGQSLLCLLK